MRSHHCHTALSSARPQAISREERSSSETIAPCSHGGGENTMLVHRGLTGNRRRPLLHGLLLLVALVFIVVRMPALAGADQMTVFSCHDPGGNPVGHDGWSIVRSTDEFITIIDTCTTDGQGDLVTELGANSGGYPNGAQAEWVFDAPLWATIASYTVQVAESYTSQYSGGGVGQDFIDASDESDPYYDYRNLGAGGLGSDTVSRTPPEPVSSITINSSCDGASGTCPSNTPIAHMYVSSASVLLDDSSIPTVSDLGGSLLSGTSVRGTGEITLNAADDGPGIYSVQLVVDGQAQLAVMPNTNNGWCENLGQTSNGTRSFTQPDPCASSTSASLTLDTASFTDGQHTLKVLVEDASGNTTIAYDGTITTDNAPANSTPPAILAPSGQLATGATLTAQPGAWSAPAGTGSITYSYAWEDCDAQENNCRAIPGAQDASYTVAPSNSGSTLRVLVTASDDDGSSSVTSTATDVLSASSSSLGALPGPGTGATGTEGGGVSAVVGTPNGTGASEGALLRLGQPSAIDRAYSHRAFRLTGRLLNVQGDPISGASLNVWQQIAGDSTAQIITHTQTGADGTFTVEIPTGPSRLINVTYRAFSTDSTYAAQAKIQETVNAGVKLTIAPLRTNPEGTITLTGTVIGPIPKRGTIVDLLVHYRGRWEPFRTPRTDAHGHFTVFYQFEGAVGRFPFRAEVPAGQTDFPFANGYSQIVDVTTS